MKLAKPMFAPHTSVTERVWYFACGISRAHTLRADAAVSDLARAGDRAAVVLVEHLPRLPHSGLVDALVSHLVMSDEWRTAAKNSFIVAPSATLVATILGTLAAVGLTKANFAGKSLLMALLISPMIVPVIVVGLGMYLFFAPLGIANTYFGLILAYAALGVPFVVTTVAAPLQNFNHNLVRASQSLGASPLRTFFRVTLPVIAPGVISGALFLAGADQTTLPRQMFTGIRETSARRSRRWRRS